MIRHNKGKPTGTHVADIDGWALYCTEQNRYKLCSKEPTNGKANYGFGANDEGIDSSAGLDCAKLRVERPTLFRRVNTFLKKNTEPIEVPPTQDGEADPYGDLAINRRKKLAPQQVWRREILTWRRVELFRTALKKFSTWEAVIRGTYPAIFQEKISDELVHEVLDHITNHAADISLETLLHVLTEYHAGKYAPTSCATLEAQFDMLAGTQEETDGESDQSRISDAGSSEAGGGSAVRERGGTAKLSFDTAAFE